MAGAYTEPTDPPHGDLHEKWADLHEKTVNLRAVTHICMATMNGSESPNTASGSLAGDAAQAAPPRGRAHLARPGRMAMPRRPHRQAEAVALLRPGPSEEARSGTTGEGDRHRRRRELHRHGRHRTWPDVIRCPAASRSARACRGSGERADARRRRKEVRAARS